MLRQLLTILAVFTGLTAAVAPVQALDISVRAEQMAEQAGAVSVQAGQPVRRGVVWGPVPSARQPSRPRPVLPVQTPAVMLKADRARE
jgi:hypothetical protein